METIDTKRILEIKGQMMTKYTFEAYCCNCHETIRFNSVSIKGLKVFSTCDHCATVNRFLIPDNEDGKYLIRDETLAIYNEVLKIFNDYGPPLTIRQIYYQLSSRGLIPKTENGYASTKHHLSQMRYKGIVPYNYFSDNTRFALRQKSYNNIQSALQETQRLYRRNLWSSGNTYIQIWVEKDALRSVFYPITWQYDVPLMIARGFASHTFFHDTADELKDELDEGKDVYIFHFGDYDPSGKMASEKINEALSILTDNRIHFKSVALNRDQIMEMKLETRPTKKSDTRSKGFNDEESCELEAVPPDILRSMVEKCITQFIDPDKIKRLKGIEEAEKLSLQHFISNIQGDISN